MTQTMHRIVYVKHFLSGPLEGLSARVHFDVDAKRCHEVQLNLQAITKDEPAADALTGTLYYTSGIGCDDSAIPQEERFTHESPCVREILAEIEQNEGYLLPMPTRITQEMIDRKAAAEEWPYRVQAGTLEVK